MNKDDLNTLIGCLTVVVAFAGDVAAGCIVGGLFNSAAIGIGVASLLFAGESMCVLMKANEKARELEDE